MQNRRRLSEETIYISMKWRFTFPTCFGLIYMSTKAILAAAASAGQLRLLQPLSPRAMRRRAMYVGRQVWELLEGDVIDSVTAERYGRLQADLENFVTEEYLYPKYLFWLNSKEDLIWEIRSVEEQPTLRVLGRFAEKDIFVALTIEERSELGGWDSESWKRAMRTTIQRWNSILPLEPLAGKDANDFFSGAIPGKYWKK